MAGIGNGIVKALKEMIAQCQKVIALLTITLDHFFCRIVAIRLCAMGMKVPLKELSWQIKWVAVH
jgi:hypothetical protein